MKNSSSISSSVQQFLFKEYHHHMATITEIGDILDIKSAAVNKVLDISLLYDNQMQALSTC